MDTISEQGDLPDEAGRDVLRRARWWAVAAFFLLLTAMWLPWWEAQLDAEGNTVDEEQAGLLPVDSAVTKLWPRLLTGALVLVAISWLFVRVAAKSWLHEPADWQRDMRVLPMLIGATLATTALWPTDAFSFWATRRFSYDGLAYVEHTRPVLGWWLAAIAGVCLLVAWWLGRDTPMPEDAKDSDGSPPQP